MSGRPDSHEPWWAPGTDTGFRQRCASALTHPATVVALATLLLNDLLFKAMWPDAWVTGKLSDLAWVILALPLLAFLLSLFTRGNAVAARAEFLTAYVGLPLLYAAFNTFEPVHYWILRGISIASGGMGQTPLDATDSIVIPLGWAVAIWVWRQPVLSHDALRLRLGLLVAGVAVLASIATSSSEPDLGITRVGVTTTEEGSVVVARSSIGSLYRSDDGGMTWTWTEELTERSVIWGSDSVLTPRGRYTVEGADIVLLARDLQSEIVYSTAYLSKSGNVWAQDKSTGRLSSRRITTQPGQLVYDERSGHLVVALGIQGVLVGTPKGQWAPIAVGRYTPTDFTFLGKTRLLLSNLGFWATALTLSMSMTGASLILSQQSRGTGWALLSTILGSFGMALLSLGTGSSMFLGAEHLLIAVGSGALGLGLLFLAGISAGMGRRPLGYAVAVLGAAIFVLLYFGEAPVGTTLIPALILTVVIAYSIWGRNSRAIWTLAFAIAVPALLASGALLVMFGGPDPGDVDQFSYRLWSFVITAVALPLGVASLLISLRLRYWRATISSLVGMNVLVILAFMLWLHLGIALALAKASAFVLTGVVAFLLYSYAKRRTF